MNDDMNILEFIDYLMDIGINEEDAYIIADAEFNLNAE